MMRRSQTEGVEGVSGKNGRSERAGVIRPNVCVRVRNSERVRGLLKLVWGGGCKVARHLRLKFTRIIMIFNDTYFNPPSLSRLCWVMGRFTKLEGSGGGVNNPYGGGNYGPRTANYAWPLCRVRAAKWKSIRFTAAALMSATTFSTTVIVFNNLDDDAVGRDLMATLAVS